MKTSLFLLPLRMRFTECAFDLPTLLVAVFALMFAGCASTGGYDTWYRITVDGDMVRNMASVTNWSRPQLPPSAAPSKESSRFSDMNLFAEWHLWDWNIKLVIKNKTDQPMSLLWPEARVAWDSREDSFQITYSEQRLSHHRLPENTLIQPGKSATYSAFPRPLLQWISWGDPTEGRGHWVVMREGASPVFGRSYPPHQKKAERQTMAREAAGHEVLVLLPLVIRGERINYKFRLKITDANTGGRWY